MYTQNRLHYQRIITLYENRMKISMLSFHLFWCMVMIPKLNKMKWNQYMRCSFRSSYFIDETLYVVQISVVGWIETFTENYYRMIDIHIWVFQTKKNDRIMQTKEKWMKITFWLLYWSQIVTNHAYYWYCERLNLHKNEMGKWPKKLQIWA